MQTRTLKILHWCALVAAIALGVTISVRVNENRHELMTAAMSMVAAYLVVFAGLCWVTIRAKGPK